MKCVISMGVPEREAILAKEQQIRREVLGFIMKWVPFTPRKRADIVLTDEELNIVKVL